jgi:WD40 repeat protein
MINNNNNIINNINYYEPIYKPNYIKNYTKITIKKFEKNKSINYIIKLSNNNFLCVSYNKITIQDTLIIEHNKKYKNLQKIKENSQITNTIELKLNYKNNKNILIAYSINNLLKIYSFELNDFIVIFNDHEWAITSIIEFEFGKILTSSNDKTIRLFDYTQKECLLNLLAHDWNINKMIILKNNENLIGTCSWDKTIKIWNINEEILYSELKGHSENVNDICEVENKKNLILSVSEDNTIKEWDFEKEICLFTFENSFENSGIRKVIWMNNNVFLTYNENDVLNFWNYNKKTIFYSFIHNGFHLENYSIIEDENKNKILYFFYLDNIYKIYI